MRTRTRNRDWGSNSSETLNKPLNCFRFKLLLTSMETAHTGEKLHMIGLWNSKVTAVLVVTEKPYWGLPDCMWQIYLTSCPSCLWNHSNATRKMGKRNVNFLLEKTRSLKISETVNHNPSRVAMSSTRDHVRLPAEVLCGDADLWKSRQSTFLRGKAQRRKPCLISRKRMHRLW